MAEPQMNFNPYCILVDQLISPVNAFHPGLAEIPAPAGSLEVVATPTSARW